MRHSAKEILMYLNKIHKGNWDKIFRDIQKKVDIPDDIDIQQNHECVCILDPNYPSKLKNSFKPPFTLYFCGNLALLNEDNIMCICGENGSNKDTIDLIKHLCDSYVLINGDDSAIERVALQTAMSEHKQFIIVLNEPIDIALDWDDELIQYAVHNDCLIISEYGYDSPEIEESEYAKTRIIGFLADKMLLVSGSKNNTRLKLLIDESLSKGSDLFALPSVPFKGSLPNMVIREGAILVDDKECFF